MGTVLSINVSPTKGTPKTSIARVKIIANHGLEGDAHAGDGDRQVSILAVETLDKVPPHKKQEVAGGGYTENFTISGIEPAKLATGNFVVIGEAIVRILHIGKDEHKEHGRPYIVSREGRFGRAVKGGTVRTGDMVGVIEYTRASFLQCVQEGNDLLVRLFLEAGMDPDTRDDFDATPLMLAARNSDVRVARALLDHGADVNAQSDDLVTALMVSAYAGHAGMVKLLLEAGADPEMVSSSGLTALKLARAGNHHAVVQLLEATGA